MGVPFKLRNGKLAKCLAFALEAAKFNGDSAFVLRKCRGLCPVVCKGPPTVELPEYCVEDDGVQRTAVYQVS